MALCVMAVVSGHMLVVAVWKRLNTCCLLLRRVVNGFCLLCTQSVARLILLGINNSLISLQPIIDDANTIQTDAKHPDVSETGLQHSGSHSKTMQRSRVLKIEITMKDIKQEFYQKESSDTRKMLR